MKKNLWLKVGILVAITCTCPIFAQSTPALDVDDAMVEALIISNNINFKGINMQFQHAKRARDNMWNEFLPQMTLGASANRVVGPNQNNLAHGNSTGGWVNTVNFGASLNLTSWVWMGMLKTQYEYEAGELSYAHAKQQLISGGLITFYALILNRDSLNLVADGVSIAEEAFAQTQRMYNNGMTSQLDLLNAEVSYQNQRNQYEQTLIDYENAVLEFKQMLGIPLDQSINLIGSIDVETYRFDTEQLLSAFSGENLAIKQALMQQTASEWNLWFNHASATFRPFVALDYSASYGTSPLTANMAAMPGSNLTPRSSLSFTVGFTMQLDAFMPWSKTGLNLWQARDGFKYQALKNTEEITTNEREIRAKTEQLNNIVARMSVLENAASVSERALVLTTTGYNQGVRTQLELDQSIIRRNEAQLNLSRSKFEYFRAIQELSIITGQSFHSLINFARSSN